MLGLKAGCTNVAAGIRKKVVIGESWGHRCFEALGKAPLKGNVNMKRKLYPLVVLMLLISFLIPGTVIAKGPPEIVIIPEGFPVTDINPCTGLEHQIGGPLTLRIHEFEQDGRYHANIQYFYDTVTSDGFTGKTLGPDIDNSLDGQGRFTSMASGTLKNDNGQIMKVHMNFQVFYDDGEITKVLVDDWKVWCAGKPN